jgi:aminoglycoside phosphotransferase (APT) family kinase protein
LTASPLDVPLQRLSASLNTAWALREAGMDFVVAPVRTSAGAIVEPAGARFAAALYPFVERDDRRPERMIVTHGEPHRANTIITADGVALIDWDTALIAPPERDLWTLIAEDPSIVEEYEARTGTTPRPELVELYALSWDIAEISIYVAGFRQPHRDTEDTRLAWTALEHHLDPARW